jgi:hypothetical protein
MNALMVVVAILTCMVAVFVDIIATVICVLGAIILWWIGMIISFADFVCLGYKWAIEKIYS